MGAGDGGVSRLLSREKAEKKVRDTPRYGAVTEGGHHWYLKSWSYFNPGAGQWYVWCEDCADYHHVEEIDPLTMTDSAREAFAAHNETREQVIEQVMRGER